MTRLSPTLRLPAVFVLLLTSAAIAFAFPTVSSAQGGPATTTLYERLGGYDFLARFVDTAFPRVASEPSLARLFRGHSTDSQMRQRQLIIDALCRETGGPCVYIGREMRSVHEGLDITAQDWGSFITIISNTLTELGVATATRAEFLVVFEERFRPTVVTR
jgi:hemoglobin